MHQYRIVKDIFFLLAMVVIILVSSMVEADEPLPNLNADTLSIGGARDLSNAALEGATVNRRIDDRGATAPNTLGMTPTGAAQTGVTKGVVANPVVGTGVGTVIGIVTPRSTYRSGTF